MVKAVKTIKLALGIEYDGSSYYGWQSQRKVDSIEEKLTYALSTIANHKVNVFCAGRTDAGVHSTGQVVHFKTISQRSSIAWTLGTNANLPNDISVRWVKIVSNEFHARFSAISRRYCYIIYNHRLRPAILSKGLTHVHHQLNIEKMQCAGQYLLGENDFTSFRSVHCQSRTPWRNIMHFNIIYQNPYIIFDIKANSFVRHMVRNIIGTIIEIGSSNKPAEWITDVLHKKDRTQAAATAKAEGLYLIEVEYPYYFLLPTSVKGPVFIHGIIN